MEITRNCGKCSSLHRQPLPLTISSSPWWLCAIQKTRDEEKKGKAKKKKETNISISSFSVNVANEKRNDVKERVIRFSKILKKKEKKNY